MIEYIPSDEIVSRASTLLSDPFMQPTLAAAHEQRVTAAAQLGSLWRGTAALAPELPDSEADEVYERVAEHERHLAAPRLAEADYGEGTATRDDEIAGVGETGSLLFEAGHSTDPVARKDPTLGGADHGTAGIVGLLAERGMGRGFVMRGRQTGNSNTAPNHPLHDAIVAELGVRPYDGFISVHGMRPGKVTGLLDSVEIHAVVGLGMEPNQASEEAADKLIAQAAVYGLRVIVGNRVSHMDFVEQEGGAHVFPGYTSRVKLDDQGMPRLTRLAAWGNNFTTTIVSRQHTSPAVRQQLEISRRLRLLPSEYWRPRDPRAEHMCVYLGYRLAEMAAQIVKRT